MIDTVFFDWGGVIADDPGDDFLKNILRDYGATEEQIIEIGGRYMYKFMRGHMSEQEYWKALTEEYNLAIPDDIATVFTAWRGIETNPDVIRLIKDVKVSGRKVALLSNVIAPTYSILQNSDSYTPFDVVIASCAEGYAKPDAEIYHLSLERAGTSAERSLFIDDKQHNLDAANLLGFSTILAQTPEQFITEARNLLRI